MPMRRESAGRRAVTVRSKRRSKPVLVTRKVVRAAPIRTSSLGGNAAAAKGYASKPSVQRAVVRRQERKAPAPRAPLRAQYRRDVREEQRPGSASNRGAEFRQRYEETARRVRIQRKERELNAKFDPRTKLFVRHVRRAILPDTRLVIDPRTGRPSKARMGRA